MSLSALGEVGSSVPRVSSHAYLGEPRLGSVLARLPSGCRDADCHERTPSYLRLPQRSALSKNIHNNITGIEWNTHVGEESKKETIC